MRGIELEEKLVERLDKQIVVAGIILIDFRMIILRLMIILRFLNNSFTNVFYYILCYL